MSQDDTVYTSDDSLSDDSLSDDSTDRTWARKRKKISDSSSMCAWENSGNVSMSQDNTAYASDDSLSDDSLSDDSTDRSWARKRKKTSDSSSPFWEKNGNVSTDQDSGCTSFNIGEDSTDSNSTENRNKISDSSSTSLCKEKTNGNVRNVYRICGLASSSEFLDCESTGQETILDMIKNRCKMSDVSYRKFNFEIMLFMNQDNVCLNVGLPVGVLSTEETYRCKFKNDINWYPSDSDHLRHYAVDKYNSNWKMGHFYLSKEEICPGVSKFTNIIPDKMRVDFFKDETFFEALVRDNRFNEKKLRFCGGKCGGARLSFSFKADNDMYRGKCIKIYPLKKEDTSLPKHITPRPCPDADMANINVEPSEIKHEMDLAPTGPTCSIAQVPLASSTPAVETSKHREDFANLINCALEIKPKEVIIKNKAKLNKLAKQCELKLKNFASEQGCNTYIFHLEELTEIAKSVGAVFVLNKAKYPHLVGTCFRIGTQYVITNNHVFKIAEEMVTKRAEVFIDFNFKKGESPSQRRFLSPDVVVRSEELDYAILRMEQPSNELPPCIFSHGISIMDPNQFQWSSLEGQCVTLIGHPHGQPKQTDLLCPVNTKPLDSLEIYGHALHWARNEGEAEKECRDSKDPRRGTYQVTTFLKGSSGSPGIVFQNDKKRLVVLHTKGFFLKNPDQNKSIIEQGVFLTEIYKDVVKRISSAHQNPFDQNVSLKYITIADIFPSVETMQTETMHIGP